MVRVSSEEKTKWINFSKDQNMSLSDIVRNLVRKAIYNPSILYESSGTDPSVILSKFDEKMEQITEQLSNYQRQNALLLKTLSNTSVLSEKENLYERFQTQLKNHPDPKSLDNYDKIEDWLVEKNPDFKKELQIEKVYYPVIQDLIQEGHIVYNSQSKKLHWQL